MTTYASGRHAIAICDRCGFETDYVDLKDQIRAGKLTGLLVCSECFDDDNEQLLLGRVRFDDPEALLNPRPDPAVSAIRGLSSFPIVGSGQVFDGLPIGFSIKSNVGAVTVSTP